MLLYEVRHAIFLHKIRQSKMKYIYWLLQELVWNIVQTIIKWGTIITNESKSRKRLVVYRAGMYQEFKEESRSGSARLSTRSDR